MRRNNFLIALAIVASLTAGCGRPVSVDTTPTASPQASASASAEATVGATAVPQAVSPSEATAEATATPSASPSATPEATASAEDATAASSEDTATVTNDGDDCGWIADPSMKDGGWCSYHPEWYGMAANGSSGSTASESQPASTASYGSVTVYNQLDSRWRNQKVGDATFGPHGCCPTALAMMLSRRGIYMTPVDVGWMLNSWGIFGNSANGFLGTRSDAWMQVADHYGWAWAELYTGDDLYNALAAGADVGLALNLGGAGHTVYVHGVDAYGNTTVYDGNSSGPYTKSVYTLMTQIYDPYSVGGAAVAIYEPGSTPAAVSYSDDWAVADVTADDNLAVADPGTIVCYDESGNQIACDF